ncbi:endonuclease domain-containing protein [Microbacterium sp. NPDC090007]|uniref:endonuclease domain-containing protein n=1 Tax=Microbacterium sp. NPDC090007 TaxID=3364204 RepID=UPI0038090D40
MTAAQHLGLWVLDVTEDVHVWMHGAGHVRAHDSCACRPHWDDVPAARVFDAPAVAVILRQILRCRGVEEFFVVLESALRQRLLTAAARTWLHDHVNDLGRAALAFARSDADSGLESLVRWRLRGHALTVRTQVRVISGGRVDILIGDRLIVEADGAPFHEGETQRHRDLRRDAQAAAWGFVTLRFDYALIVHDWPTVELAILAYVDLGLHRGR